MKLPKPTQKENGKWIIQVMIDGKRYSKQFDSEREALYWAAGMKTKQRTESVSPHNLTLRQATEKYIESKNSVLSPSTVAGYIRLSQNHFQELSNIKLSDLRVESIQRAVNKMAKDYSPKTVKNAYGLLTAVLGEYLPGVNLRSVKLPQRERVEIVVPSEKDILDITNAVKGTSAELPTLLAMWLGLRMSEIRGLTWDCVTQDTIHIKQALVDEGLKTTKTYSSNRVLPLPPYIKKLIDQQEKTSSFIVPASRRAIHSRFQYYLNKSGVKHFRFHDLRHVNASVMLALNVPDKYAMQRMGHASTNMLKTVYQHTMTEKQVEVGNMLDNYFSKIVTPE